MEENNLIYGNLKELKDKCIDLCGEKIGEVYYNRLIDSQNVENPKPGTLKFFILKYNSIDIGIAKYYEKNKKCAPTGNLESVWKKKYGEEKAAEMFLEYRRKLGASLMGKNTIEYYIEIYGEDIGPLMYIEYCGKISETSKGRNNKESFIKKFGKKEGLLKHKEFWFIRSRRDKEYFCRRYGVEYGTIKYENYIKSTTTSKPNFIKKYGRKEGIRRYKLKTKRWLETLSNKPQEEKDRINRAKCFKRSFSKISQDLFWEIFEWLKHKNLNIFFATFNNETKEADYSGTNNEFIVYFNKTNHAFLDFYIQDINKCIEFDGTFWHKNTEDRDKERENKIKSVINCEFYRVKQKDFEENREYVIQKCMEFLDV